MNKGLNKYNTYIHYCNTNKILNILFGDVFAVLFSILSFLFWKIFGYTCDVYGIGIVIIILTILSFIFQNSDHDHIYFLTFLCLLFFTFIVINYDFCIKKDLNYYRTLDFDPTFITCVLDVIILVIAKLKYEDTIPFYLKCKDFFNSKIDGHNLKKQMDEEFKENYNNITTNYLETLNINKTNIFNSLEENFINSTCDVKKNIFDTNNKKDYYIQHSKVLEDKINEINKNLEEDNTGTQRYHLVNTKEKLINEKIDNDNELHDIENDIYAYECEYENLKDIYKLEMLHIENDYKIRYKKYLDSVKKIIKSKHKKITFIKLVDIKNYLKKEDKDESNKQDKEQI